jgi:phosphatidylglycerol:prolipoprotein diacylglycerol transferase
MHPICFYVFSWPIYWYGVMVALAFMLSVAHWNLLGRRQGREPGFGSELALWLVVGGIIGARLAYVAANWTEYIAQPQRILFIREGGLVFYGGWFGGTAALWLFSRLKQEPLLPLADFTISAIPLAHAVGRIGCFLNGCCYGSPTTVPWGVCLEGAMRHPTQLYEFAVNVAVYGMMWAAILRKLRPGALLALYLMTYPAGRFVIEFFRGDPRIRFAGLTLAQLISLAMVVGGLVLWRRVRRNPSLAQTPEQ